MPIDQIMEPEFKESLIDKIRPKRKIILAVGGLVFVAIAAFLLVLFLTSQKSGEKIFLQVVPSPVPSVTEKPLRPSSPYATDAAILKIEEDLKSLDQELQTTDLKESGLNPPVLDMKVEFNEP